MFYMRYCWLIRLDAGHSAGTGRNLPARAHGRVAPVRTHHKIDRYLQIPTAVFRLQRPRIGMGSQP